MCDSRAEGSFYFFVGARLCVRLSLSRVSVRECVCVCGGEEEKVEEEKEGEEEE